MARYLLGFADIAIVVVTLILASSTGLYYRFFGGRQKTTVEYLLADKQANVISVAFSLMATFLSTVLLAFPAESYSFGSQFFLCGIGQLLFVPLVVHYMYPVFFKMQLISPFQYLEKRFSYKVRFISSLLTCFLSIVSCGISLYVPSLALESMASMSHVESLLVMGILCTFYSSVGGIKAIIVADVFQAMLMFVSLFAIIISTTLDVGFLNIWRIAQQQDRLEFFIFDPDPTVRHTFWNLIIGGGVSYMTSLVVYEAYVQRFMAFSDFKNAARAMYISAVLIFILVSLALFAGLAIYTHFVNCDPVLSGSISKYDEIVPYYVYHRLSQIPGMTGIFLAGVIAASLSSVSSSINGIAAMIVEDYIRKMYIWCYRKECPDSKALFFAKFFSVVTGLLSLAISFLVVNASSVLQIAITFYYDVSPIFGIFVLGMFFPFANEKGAMVGLLSGIIIVVWASLGWPKPELERLPMSVEACHNATNLTNDYVHLDDTETEYFYLYKISYMWYSVLGFLPAVIVGAIVSLLTNCGDYEKRDPNFDLFSPPVANYLRWKSQHPPQSVDKTERENDG